MRDGYDSVVMAKDKMEGSLTRTRVLTYLSCLWFLILAATDSPAELTIDSDFDSGSIETYNIVGNEIDLTLHTDELGYTYWTYFKVTGVLDQEVTFNITNADEVPFLSDTAHESQIVYSYDSDDWYRMIDHSYAAGTYTFTHTFTSPEVQIATFFPFSYEEMHDYVDMVNNSPWATEMVLGSSHQGRDIDLLTITNTTIPPVNKKVIYIIGRQHAAEVSSSHMIKGMVDFLVSDHVDAAGFRDDYVWCVVPMVNPDGVYLGNSRATSQGNDANRDWGNTDTVEINVVRSHIGLTNSTDGIYLFIDWHSQMNDDRWYNFVYSPTGNTFFGTLSAWTDFDSQSAFGASSCTAGSCTARGYVMTNIIFDPMFVLEPTPHLASWTQDSLQEQGKLVAYAINEYFGLYQNPNQPLLVDSRFDDSNDDSGLRANSEGQDWYESRGANPTRLSLDVDDIGGNNTKKAALRYYGIGGDSYVYLTQEFRSALGGTFGVSLSIYIDRILNEGGYDRTGYIYIGDDNVGTNGPCSTSSERFIYLTFYDSDPDSGNDDLEIRAREYDGSGVNGPPQPWADTSTWTQIASGLSYDTWYTIRIALDILGGTYDVHVDDVLKGDDINGYEGFPSSTVTHISFSCGTEGEGDFYVDDIMSPPYNPDCCESANLDGSDPVDLEDFSVLANDWQATGWDVTGDITRDRITDMGDLIRLAHHWLDSCDEQ